MRAPRFLSFDEATVQTEAAMVYSGASFDLPPCGGDAL